MDFTRFGYAGLVISRICLGTIPYGTPTDRWPWALDEEQSRPFIQKALDLSSNFFDTADVYSGGMSEEVVGGALRDFAKRNEIVLATREAWYTECSGGTSLDAEQTHSYRTHHRSQQTRAYRRCR